ncbi:MAG: hypothetical protein QOF50_1958, partial [Gaiellaceae bacterium]|nr:hypothetical protein [Gaiellaceae bacterium]
WPFITESSEPDGGVLVFAREPSGAIVQPADSAACISALGGDCRQGRGMNLSADFDFNLVGLATSPKGDTVYITTLDSAAGPGTISVFSDSLVQLPAQFGCVGVKAQGCASGRALQGISSVAVSPDGKNLYGTSYWDAAVAAFSRTR